MDNNQKLAFQRIFKCANDQCGEICPHCRYREKAAEMVLEFLLMDITTYYNNTGRRISSWDVKDIFCKAYDKIVELESEKKSDD